jgi:CTP:molybdopterin cytidylyltransferase MocA
MKKSFLGTYVHYVEDPCMLVDIDTMDDLKLAERIIKHGMFDFGLQ